MANVNHISLRQLRCFVTVADELHFHRAAEKLHMRQPPLTQRIKDMERDLGVELFRRAGNKVELTDAGRMVLKSAKETLAHVEGLCEMAQRAARGECGQIRIGLTITALLFDSIRRAIRAFQQENPDVALRLAQICSGPALEGLLQRKWDVCLIRAFPAPLPLNCEEIVIARDQLMLVLPSEHAKIQAERIPLSAVADERFISLTPKRGIAIHHQIMNLWERAGVRPRIAQEAENGQAVLALVAAGLGNAILPSSLQAIRFEHVVWKTIDIDDRWTQTSLNLVYNKESLAERVPAAFIECLRRHSCQRETSADQPPNPVRYAVK